MVDSGRIVEIIILGSGSSACTPNLTCVIPNDGDNWTRRGCKVCRDAADRTDGRWSRNRRLNTSALIRYGHSDGTIHEVLIDCGKTFYYSASEWMVQYQVGGRLDGVILTHGHSDAMMGLDDLRHWTGHGAMQSHPLPVFLDRTTLATVGQTFPYLVDSSLSTGSKYVGSLDFTTIQWSLDTPCESSSSSFMVGELRVIPVPVEHGVSADGRDKFYSLGLYFPDDGVAYISDVNAIPPSSIAIIKDCRLLIVDCLRIQRRVISHYNLEDALDLVQQLEHHHHLKQVLLVGISHDVDYDEMAEACRAQNLTVPVSPAWDGMRIQIRK